MSIITSYNSHFEVHVISYYIIVPINTPHVHTCSAFYLAVTANLIYKLCVTEKMSDTGESDTARALAQMQATMERFNQELIAIKSGSTSVGTNPPPGAPSGVQDSGSSGIRSGEAGQRRRGRETDEDDDDVERDCDDPDDDDLLLDEATTFPLSEAGNAFLEAAFSKRMEKKTYENRIQKCGTPDSRWSKCPDLDAVVVANLPKDTVRTDAKAKRLHSFWLSAVAPLAAGLQDIEDGKGDIQDAAKAMQAALMFLGNASQHHAVQRRQAVLQQLNPQLKSLIKDEDFKDAPPYLFGEHFASVAKERLEAAAVLKKSVATGSKQGFQRSHPQNYSQPWGRRGGQFRGKESYRGKRPKYGAETSASRPGASQPKK